MSLYLSKEELFELTGFKQRAKQRAALAEMGVKFKTRPADGFPLVDRDYRQSSQPQKRREPDWSALRN